MKTAHQPAGTDYFPQKGFITFDQANVAAIMGGSTESIDYYNG